MKVCPHMKLSGYVLLKLIKPISICVCVCVCVCVSLIVVLHQPNPLNVQERILARVKNKTNSRYVRTLSRV